MRVLLLVLAGFCALATLFGVAQSFSGAPLWVPVIWGLLAIVFGLIAGRLPKR